MLPGAVGKGLEILVRPGGSRDEVVGEHDGALVVRLTAPPVDGRANRALRKLIAKRVGVPASQVTISRGEHSRHKLVVVEGVEPAPVRGALVRD